MKLKIIPIKNKNKRERIKQSLISSGAPAFVFNDNYATITKEQIPLIVVEYKKKVIKIDRKEQIKNLKKILLNGISKPYTYVISSEPYDYNALKISASIYCRMKLKGYRVRWFNVYNELSTVKEQVGEITNQPDFIIISNITDRISDFKADRVRDFLFYFSNIPKIVVIGTEEGYTGFEFFIDVLHFKPDYSLHLTYKGKL